MARVRIAAVFLTIVALLIGAPTTANATITWDSNSLTLVYRPAGNQFYAYAPSVVLDGAATRIWTCHNSLPGVIRDSVYSTVISGGLVTSDRAALSPTGTGWDGFHNCDPSVVRVNVSYGSTSYQYAMFYTGNDLDASSHNQVGVAFANSLDGPWTRYLNPIVPFAGSDTSQWGAGQPSATTIDPQAGRVLLFWTEGYGQTSTYRAEVDFNNPSGPVIGSRLQVTKAGLTGTDGGSDWLNDADFAYDPSRDRFYAVREQHPYPTDQPTYISANQQLVSIAGSSIWNGGGTWTVENAITPALTSFARNHNAGITRNIYGTLISPGSITVVFTTACGNCTDSLWTYALHQITGSVS